MKTRKESAKLDEPKRRKRPTEAPPPSARPPESDAPKEVLVHGLFKAGKQIGVTKPHVCSNPPTCTEEES